MIVTALQSSGTTTRLSEDRSVLEAVRLPLVQVYTIPTLQAQNNTLEVPRLRQYTLLNGLNYSCCYLLNGRKQMQNFQKLPLMSMHAFKRRQSTSDSQSRPDTTRLMSDLTPVFCSGFLAAACSQRWHECMQL